jgi:hypothetical protein
MGVGGESSPAALKVAEPCSAAAAEPWVMAPTAWDCPSPALKPPGSVPIHATALLSLVVVPRPRSACDGICMAATLRSRSMGNRWRIVPDGVVQSANASRHYRPSRKETLSQKNPDESAAGSMASA